MFKHCRNIDDAIISSEQGDFEVEDGKIALKGKYIIGQWIYLGGSILNDGMYLIRGAESSLYSLSNGSDEQIPTQGNEAFTGQALGLRVDQGFIALANEIRTFNEKNKPTGKASEKFGAYSYTRATGSNGAAIDWKEAFRNRLNPYRKMFSKINLNSPLVINNNTGGGGSGSENPNLRGIKAQIEAMKQDIGNLKSGVSTNKSDIQGVQLTLADLEEQLRALLGLWGDGGGVDLSGLFVDIQGLRRDVTALEERLEDIDTGLIIEIL